MLRRHDFDRAGAKRSRSPVTELWQIMVNKALTEAGYR